MKFELTMEVDFKMSNIWIDNCNNGFAVLNSKNGNMQFLVEFWYSYDDYMDKVFISELSRTSNRKDNQMFFRMISEDKQEEVQEELKETIEKMINKKYYKNKVKQYQ